MFMSWPKNTDMKTNLSPTVVILNAGEVSFSAHSRKFLFEADVRSMINGFVSLSRSS